MDIESLKNYLLPRTPFAEVEALDGIVEAGFEDAVNYYNKFNPDVELIEVYATSGTSYEFVGSRIPDVVLRMYFFDRMVHSHYKEDIYCQWTYDKPILYCYSGDFLVRVGYNIKMDLSDDSTVSEIAHTKLIFEKHNYLARTFVCECNLKMADKRRSAEMNELPFNLKGDLFYDQFMEERRELREAIMNLPDVVW